MAGIEVSGTEKSKKERFVIHMSIVWGVKRKVEDLLARFFNSLEPAIYDGISENDKNLVEKIIYFRLLDSVLAHIEPRMHNPLYFDPVDDEEANDNPIFEPRSNFIYDVTDDVNYKSANFVYTDPKILDYIIEYELYFPKMMLNLLSNNRVAVRGIVKELIFENKSLTRQLNDLWRSFYQPETDEEVFVQNLKNALMSIRNEGLKPTHENIAKKMGLNARQTFESQLEKYHIKRKLGIYYHSDGTPL